MKIRLVKIDPVLYRKTGFIKEIEYSDVEILGFDIGSELKKITRFGAYIVGYEVGRMWSLSYEGQPYVFINGVISHAILKDKEQDFLWNQVIKKISQSSGFYNDLGKQLGSQITRIRRESIHAVK